MSASMQSPKPPLHRKDKTDGRKDKGKRNLRRTFDLEGLGLVITWTQPKVPPDTTVSASVLENTGNEIIRSLRR